MVDLSKTPRVAAYLRAQKVNPSEEHMNEYWAALIVAESFKDKALRAFGGINFHTMKGSELLMRMEQFLEYRSNPAPKSSKPVKKAKPLNAITGSVTDAEIRAAMSPKGGWSRSTLAKWGVPWPPPKGWRAKLTSKSASHVSSD